MEPAETPMLALQCAMCLSVAQLCCAQPGVPFGAPPKQASEPAKPDWSSRSSDEVIQALPHGNDEIIWDDKLATFGTSPVVEEMVRRLTTQKLSAEQWQRALRVSKAIDVPALWPKGTPLIVSNSVPRWLGPAEIRAVPVLRGLASFKAGDLEPSDCGFGRDEGGEHELGVLPPESKAITFTVTVEIGSPWRVQEGLAPGIVFSGPMTFPIQQVASFNETMTDVSGPEIDAAMRASFGAGWRDWPTDLHGHSKGVGYVNIAPNVTRDPVLGRLALDTVVELLCDDKVIEVVRVGLIDECPRYMPRSMWGLNYYNSENLVCKPDDSGRWSIRVTGGGANIQAKPKIDRRWKGQFVIPWAEAAQHEKARLEERERRFAEREHKPAGR